MVKPNQVGIRPFKIPRHLPPEFKALPLDLLRTDQWPVWPERTARGFMSYPSPNATALPVSAEADPISNAKDAVVFILACDRMADSFFRSLRKAGDSPMGKAVKNARYAGMEENTYVRTSNPPRQSYPWINHEGIWSLKQAVDQFISRSKYPGASQDVMDAFVASFRIGRRER